MAKPKLEHWPIEKILPYAQNAMMHGPEQIKQLMASIKEFGFINPVIVDKDGVLIAGHGRIEAASNLGLATVPVIRAGHLNEAQVIALRLADNSIGRSADSSWSPELVTAELDKLDEMNFDVSALGLDTIELPEFEDSLGAEPPKKNRSKGTIFLSVKNADMAKARSVCVAALNKAKIEHNL